MSSRGSQRLLADPASSRLGSETFGVEAMLEEVKEKHPPIFRFTSETAQASWEWIGGNFGNGVWQDVDFSWDRQGAAMASGWWEEQAKAFAQARGRSTSEAERLRNEVRDAINGFFGDERPDVDKRDYVRAIKESLTGFMNECEPTGSRRSDKSTMLFEDCAVTIFKNIIARVEHEARTRSSSTDPQDKIAKTLEFPETLLLLRLRDVSGQNLLPPRLSLPGDTAPPQKRASPSDYFTRMMRLTVDTFTGGGPADYKEWDSSFQGKDSNGKDIKVTRQLLAASTGSWSQFFYDVVESGVDANRTRAFGQLGDAVRYISAMDTYIRSDDKNKNVTDRANMAVQKCLFVESWGDVVSGGVRTGTGECFDGKNPNDLKALETSRMTELVRRGPVDPRPFHH